MSAARSELGPVLPSRLEVHLKARELLSLAQRAAEFSTGGPRCDLALAVRQLERMREVLGND